MPGRFRGPGTLGFNRAYLLLLLPLERFSPPWLLRLLLPLLAPPRLLCESLLPLLERLLLSRREEEDDFELRAIAGLLCFDELQ